MSTNIVSIDLAQLSTVTGGAATDHNRDTLLRNRIEGELKGYGPTGVKNISFSGEKGSAKVTVHTPSGILRGTCSGSVLQGGQAVGGLSCTGGLKGLVD